VADFPLVCISFSAFPLQILQREKGLGRDVPLVVVRSERPGATILACNPAAAACGVSVGMSYSQALSLSGRVVAGVVSPEIRDSTRREITALLGEFSPLVEESPQVEGVFWIGVNGLDRLFGGIRRWTSRLEEACRDAGWVVRIARGWTRPGTLMAALQAHSPDSFLSVEAERGWLIRQPLAVLPLGKRDRRHLHLLGFTRVEQIVTVPMEELAARFSSWTMGLFRFLRETRTDLPVQGEGSYIPFRWERRFEPPITYWAAVRTALEDALMDVVFRLPERGEWIEGYTLSITFENAPPRREEIHCGRATRDVPYLMRLFDLRASRLHLSRQFMTGVTVEVRAGTGEIRQGELDLRLSRRDPLPGAAAAGLDRGSSVEGAEAAEGVPSGPAPDPGLLDRTVAVLQAQLGSDGVVRAATAPGRFPEDRFVLLPLENGRDLLPRRSAPGPHATSRLGELSRVRRIFLGAGGADPAVPGAASLHGSGTRDPAASPRRAEPRHGDGDRPPDAPSRGAMPFASFPSDRVAGPYLLLSSWWDGPSLRRQYEYRRDSDGRTAWGYRTDGRSPFRLQGYVE
jgi:nucleotidyltransferase/DNA polymerase involved in DNA repair